MTSRKEKQTLLTAAGIIERELEAGNDVPIRGFGKLYLSRVNWTDKDTGDFGKVNTVRFRPFGALKEAVGNREMLGTLQDGQKQMADGFSDGPPAPRDPSPEPGSKSFTPATPSPLNLQTFGG